jgi:hypothetical protein
MLSVCNKNIHNPEHNFSWSTVKYVQRHLWRRSWIITSVNSASAKEDVYQYFVNRKVYLYNGPFSKSKVLGAEILVLLSQIYRLASKSNYKQKWVVPWLRQVVSQRAVISEVRVQFPGGLFSHWVWLNDTGTTFSLNFKFHTDSIIPRMLHSHSFISSSAV